MPIPVYRYNLTLQQKRISLGFSLNSSRTVSLLDRHLGFSMPLAEGQQANKARGGGGWQPCSSGLIRFSGGCEAPIARVPAASTAHASSLQQCDITSFHIFAAHKKAQIITRGGLHFLPTFSSIESSIS